MDIDIAKLRGNCVYLEFLSPGHRETLRFLAKNELIWEFNKLLPTDDSYDATYDDHFDGALDKNGLDGQKWNSEIDTNPLASPDLCSDNDRMCFTQLYSQSALNLQNMKRYLLFMVTLAIPLVVLVWLSRKHEISSVAFTVLMFVYTLFYHPIISMIRLVALGLVAKGDIWKSLIPFWNWKYSADAVFGNKK